MITKLLVQSKEYNIKSTLCLSASDQSCDGSGCTQPFRAPSRRVSYKF